MVLSLKTWKSRSLPVLPRTNILSHDDRTFEKRPSARAAVLFLELPSKNRKAVAADPRRLFPLPVGSPQQLGASRQSGRIQCTNPSAKCLRPLGKQLTGEAGHGLQVRCAPLL